MKALAHPQVIVTLSVVFSFCILQIETSEIGTRNWDIVSVDFDYDTSGSDKDANKAGRSIRERRRTPADRDKSSEEDYDENQMLALSVKRSVGPAPELPANQRIRLPPGYSIYEIPKELSRAAMPLFVYVHIKKILDFDEINSMMKLDIEMIVKWTDFAIMNHNAPNESRAGNRSRFYVDEMSTEERRQKRVTLNNPNILNTIWKPNLFIENLLSVRQPSIMARPLTVKFIPEAGAFEYITRLAVTIGCDMDFHYYPADTQVCGFSIRGFSYVRTDLSLNWYRSGAYLDLLHLPSWDVKLDDTTKYDWEREKDDNFPEIFEMLAFKIFARRRLSYHLVQTYLSSMFYIIITCLCFLVPARFTEARIGIAMTALLTLTAMFGSVRESTPIVSYVKAIDIWMVCCIFFVFLALAQITFHTWFKNVKQNYEEADEEAKKLDQQQHSQPPSVARTSNEANKISRVQIKNQIENDPELVSLTRRKHSTVSVVLSKRTLKKYEQYVIWINRYSFVLFITLFLAFCITYWGILLSQSDYFDWNINPALNNVKGPKRGEV